MASEGDVGQYALDLKENLVRRAIALTIDHAVLSVISTIVGGFLIAGVFFGNPIAVLFGLPAGFLLKSSNSIGTEPQPMVYMISLMVLYFLLSLLFFSLFESNGRRTPGKAAMHLEVLNEDGYFPGFSSALKRNLLKSISGALGGYFLGLLGAGLLMGLASYVDIKASPSSKGDLRQRRSEVGAGTAVLLEDEETPFGKISKFSGDWKKARDEKAKMRIKLPSLRTSNKEAGAEDGTKKRLFFKKKEKAAKEVAEVPSKEEEEAPSHPTEKELAVNVSAGPEPAPDVTSKDVDKEESVLRLMIELDIDEIRSRALCEAGYRKKEDLMDAIPQDLLMVKGINPTIAKRIIEKAKAST